MRAVAYFLPLLFSVGCTRQMFSPPSRALPLETPATLDPGKSGLQLEGSGNGAMFGPDVYVGTARVRHGVAKDVDVSGEGTVMHLDSKEPVGTHPNAYAVRGGVKYRLFPALAVAAGLGGGASVAGGFVSPDFAVMTGYENRYFVPFFTLRAFTSHPLGARTVYLGDSDNAPVYDRARLTYGYGWVLGGKVPLAENANVIVAAGANYLHDARGKEAFAGLATALEMIF